MTGITSPDFPADGRGHPVDSDGQLIVRTFECDSCHGTFERIRSDAEALAEARTTWRGAPREGDLAIICEDCYQALIARVQAAAPELLRPSRSHPHGHA